MLSLEVVTEETGDNEGTNGTEILLEEPDSEAMNSDVDEPDSEVINNDIAETDSEAINNAHIAALFNQINENEVGTEILLDSIFDEPDAQARNNEHIATLFDQIHGQITAA